MKFFAIISILFLGSTSFALDCYVTKEKDQPYAFAEKICFGTIDVRANEQKTQELKLESQGYTGFLPLVAASQHGNTLKFLAQGKYINFNKSGCLENLSSEISFFGDLNEKGKLVKIEDSKIRVEYKYNPDSCHLTDREGEVWYEHVK